LVGFVRNDSRGVVIEVQGPEACVREFERRLTFELRSPARIDEMNIEVLPSVQTAYFSILPSDPSGKKETTVLADIAPCADCLAELRDPSNHRYRYPFTNCTHCGPRFTIVQGVPYDRPNTTMKKFVQCPHCQAEYDDPSNRRFHAQPNACPHCGPSLRLLDGQGTEVAHKDEALAHAVRAVTSGKILALQGLGGFQLMVDATNDAAVERLRLRKHRWEKPFAVMVSSLDDAHRFARLDAIESALLASPEAPIVLVERRSDTALSALLAPGNPRIGLMLPSSPLHHLLMADLGLPVVATSGNHSEEPICIAPDEAVARLGNIADTLLVHDRPIERHADDSVISLTDGEPQLLRRARGYAPLPILLHERQPVVLALGGHLKNTVALSVGDRCFLSQHVGDLDSLETRNAFLRVINDFLRLYETRPVAIAHDLHDDYASSQIAEQLTQPGGLLDGLPRIQVQHHHAHLASCLADADVDEPVLGVVWDGSGLGTDRTIWGGEFLYGNAAQCERIASLLPFRLPGGDTSARSPRRIALALLLQHFSIERLQALGCRSLDATPPKERDLIAAQLEKKLFAPYTSSMGRLFDAVSSLLGLVQNATFEGQAAMALEFIAEPHHSQSYPLHIEESTLVSNNAEPRPSHASPRNGESPSVVPNVDTRFSLDPREMLETILMDVAQGVPPPIVSARFHNGLALAVAAVAHKVGAATVALSGGCFQNRLLTERCRTALSNQGHRVLVHRQVPPNDGGLALGQLAVACSRLARN
jgi:hydrogenase maturation protein HypF